MGRDLVRGLCEHSAVQLGQGATGVDAQLLAQVSADPRVDRQGLGLSAQPLGRAHAQGRGSLVEGVTGHELEGEVVSLVRVAARVVEQRDREVVEQGPTQVAEPRPFDEDEVVAHSLEGHRSGPQSQGCPVGLSAPRPVALRGTGLGL